MKEVRFTCDKCKQPIGIGQYQDAQVAVPAGQDELAILTYTGLLEHNQVPAAGEWHLHYRCFSEVVAAIQANLEEGRRIAQ